ncbi:MAG TPA: prolyl oligopeptidase family serine peptidase [Candidatus Saccharimonadales bacterium]|nr:prolyl oligopeptidase family serine peptidase [Candidatus Saccharimonadales bacterium]
MNLMKSLIKIVLAVGVCMQMPWHGFAAPHSPPVAPVENVTNVYFGTPIVDPYRYMEDLSNTNVAAWMKAQNDYTRSVLDSTPGRKPLLARIEELVNAVTARVESVRRLPDGRLFYLKRLPQDNTFKLYVREGLTGKETLLFDPEKLAKAAGKPFAINYYEPSPNGNYVACGLSEGGSEDAVIHVIETATGKEVGKPIDRAQFGGISWRPDGKSLFYNRLQKMEPGMPETARYEKSRVYLHVIGADADKEKPVFGYEVSPLVKMEPADDPFVVTEPGCKYAIGLIEHGTQNEFTMYVAPLAFVGKTNTPWKETCDVEDDVTDFAVKGKEIFLKTHKDAPRFKIIMTSLAKPDLATAKTVVPTSDAVITGLASAKDSLYVQLRDGGIGRLLHVPYGGKPDPVALPFAGSLSLAAVDPRLDGTWLDMGTWTKAGQIYAYDPKTKKITNTGLQPLGQFDAPTNLESVEVKARSYDGTMIPLSIVYKRGLKLDGSNPTLLWGYGAYGISQDPVYGPVLLAWYEKGGVFAVAHVRGGGEYGEDWYKGGYKQTKPNTWKDFIACAEYLIRHKYTSPDRLAGEGGSAGGILTGRAITTRPDLFGAAIIQVGCLDMLRIETTPNGVPNIPEFGSVKTKAGFKDLYEMSAYAHVKKGTKYPAVLLETGINDPRVEPWQSAKMAARLQAATTSGKPILLRVDYEAGHGIGSTKKQNEEQTADGWSFLLWQFGMPGFQPPDAN